jgi:glycosyltransferase involved in cell wall biosynthesis
MDLYVNGRYAGRRVTGVERFAIETTRALGSRAHSLMPPFQAGGVLGHLWEQALLPSQLPKTGLLWSPANTGPLRVERQVVTIHDLAPLDHPEWYRGLYAWWYRWLLPRLAAGVRAVIAVSEFTRGRLLSAGIPGEKVFVVRPGVSPRFASVPEEARRRLRARFGLPGRYVLVVGTIEPRKNLPRLCRAWGRISSSFPEAELVMAGGRGRVFRRVALGSLPKGVRLLGEVAEGDLPALYAEADAFVLASLYEGFGLTPLEAMASGIPCLVSKMGGIPEAVGDAALLIDPNDEGAMEAGLRRILSDEPLRETLRARGVERARSLRWEDTAAKLWSVCCQVGEDVG